MHIMIKLQIIPPQEPWSLSHSLLTPKDLPLSLFISHLLSLSLSLSHTHTRTLFPSFFFCKAILNIFKRVFLRVYALSVCKQGIYGCEALLLKQFTN